MTTWKYVINETKAYALIVEEDGTTVAQMHTYPGSKRFEANVKLMTVAPKLLAALQWAFSERLAPDSCEHDYGDDQPGSCVVCCARAAIASATSEQPVAEWDDALPEKLAIIAGEKT